MILPNLKLIGLSGLAGLLLGALSAWWLTSTVREAAKVKPLESQVAAIKLQIGQERANYVEALDSSERAGRKVVVIQGQVREVEKVVYKDVVRYVQSDPGCNLTVGAVRLLNRARELSDSSRAISPEPPVAAKSPAAAAAESPTDFTLQDEVQAHAGCALQYAELAASHNALIDQVHEFNSKAK